MNIAKSNEYIKNFILTPNSKYSNSNNTPVRSSTIKYCADIFSLQNLHLPLSRTWLINGILSNHFMLLRHLGHRDGGDTIDFCLGIRQIHTFKKLPIHKPNIKTKKTINSYLRFLFLLFLSYCQVLSRLNLFFFPVNQF